MRSENAAGIKADGSVSERYLRYTWRKTLFLLLIAAIIFILSVFTIRLGGSGISYAEILTQLFFPDNSVNTTIVWDIRMPPVAGALAAGAALGIAGAVMQAILRNPLASPFTLGISNASAFGAAFGVMVLEGIVVFDTVTMSDSILVAISAFIFAMAATGVMILLVKLTDSTPETIVLAGLAISSIFSAALASMQYFANDAELAEIVYWQFGSLGKITWDNIFIIAAVLFISSAYFMMKRWDYNAAEAGEDVAKGLGVGTESTRVVGMVISAVLTATVVSFAGIIGFIGLIGPHMVKKFIGNDNRFTLIGSALMGAFILLLAHVVGSFAFHQSIPVGIITSAIGGPLFILILLKGRVKRRC